MSISSSSSARRAGFKVNDKAIKDLAAIAMTKIGCRTLYVALPAQAWHLAGTTVQIETDGIFNVINFPEANVGGIYTSFRLPAEWDSGTVVVSIYWKTTAVTGNARFAGDLASKAVGGTTALEESQTVVTAVNATAGQINKSQMTFLAADFTAGDLVGLNVSRDPANIADTMGGDIKIVGVVVEFTGRG